jgi:protein phosphatase 1L
MEDDFVITHDLCGVFDGHGGRQVSAYLAHNLPAELQASQNNNTNTLQDHEHTLRTALQQIDEKVLQIRHWSYQGSTAVVLYYTPQGLLVANVGDSRAVLSHQTRALPLTRDHKPNDPHEWARIEAMGGTVEFDGYVDPQGVPFGCYRVNGNLAMSRAIGDRSERPMVTAEPDICFFELTTECDFVVLATDGLWDVMDNEEVVQYIHKYGQREEVASWLVEEALRRGSLDNITVVIVWFQHASQAKAEEDF